MTVTSHSREVLAEPGPGKAVQERGGEVGLDEHPAEEEPGADEGPEEVDEENLEVEELFDYYDPYEVQLHRRTSAKLES